MQIDSTPKIITFPDFGSEDEGFISVAGMQYSVPFDIKRVFWAYNTPGHIVRGRHAHKRTEMVLIAAKGRIKVECSRGEQFKEKYVLEQPNIGLYIPPMYWHTMKYSKDAVQIVLTSTEYYEQEYVRDHKVFLDLIK